MEQFFNNRYTQLTLLTMGMALLFYAIIWIVFTVLNIHDFPAFVQFVLAVCGAGIVVYKFFSQRIV